MSARKPWYHAFAERFCVISGQLYGPDGLPERTEYFKDIHIYHTRTKKWSVLNQERELKMESLPYLMSYRIVPRRYRGGKTYPLPRVDVSS